MEVRMVFPREHKGYIDDGKNLSPEKKCPNCNSSKYIETVSLEKCTDCGLECDYWSGSGANEVYEGMMERKRESS